ncbi:hypothetical protein B9Z65_2666 [Elsinoe australis]|uniref:Nephrocystin 3-like N-terminal domain-containing protein n=1 Tax=Elsinoe australis TaxID=40998 RepID=A0A2P8A481_9PEZI|nr:hypothetical protein B9Z65_2666 [Elsinoe australis]
MVIQARRRDSPVGSPIDEYQQLPEKLLHIDFAARQRYLVDKIRCFQVTDWIFGEEIFQAWIESEKRWQLRLCGPPRSGKTNICALAVSELLQRSLYEGILIVQLYLGDLASSRTALTPASTGDDETAFSVQDFVLRATYRQLLETDMFDIPERNVPSQLASEHDSDSAGKWHELQSAFESLDNVFLIVDGLEHMTFGIQEAFYKVLDTARSHGMRTMITQDKMSNASGAYVFCGLENEHPQYDEQDRERCSIYWHCESCDDGDFDVCRTCRIVRRLGCHDDAHSAYLFEPYEYRNVFIRWPEEILRQYITWELNMAGFKRTDLGRTLNQQDHGTENLVQEICRRSGGDLALARIYIERTLRDQSPVALSGVLDELPEDEQYYFAQTLTQLRLGSGDSWGLVEEMIALVAHSPVPLRFEAFIEAITFRHVAHDSTTVPPLERENVMRLSKGTLNVQDNTDGFVEFLQTELGTFFLECRTARSALEDTFLTDLCLDYLNQDWLALAAPDEDYISFAIYRKHPFLAYASRFFGECIRRNSSRSTRCRLIDLLGQSGRVNAIVTAAWYADLTTPWMLPLGATSFHMCAYLGLADVLLDLAQFVGYNVNTRDTFLGNTPIITAAHHGYADTVKILLDLGADPGIVNFAGRTALDQAIESDALQVVEVLVTHPEYRHYQHWLENGARAPLQAAAASDQDNCQMIRLILTMNQSNTNVRDVQGRTPLLTSIVSGNITTATLLAKQRHVDVSASDAKGRNALHLLLDNALQDNALAIDGLHSEILESCVELLDVILGRLTQAEKTEILNQKDHTGRIPLMSAIAAIPKYPSAPEMSQIIDCLVVETADLLQIDHQGRTLMHYAALNDNADLIVQLREKNLDVNKPDHAGRTPLHLSCAKGCENAAGQLYMLDARIEGKDAFHQSPLDYAVLSGVSCIFGEEFFERTDPASPVADPPIWTVVCSDDATTLSDMIQYGPELVQVVEPSTKTSALHFAVSAGVEMLEAILVSGLIDPNIQDLSGRTPLQRLVNSYQPGDMDKDDFRARITLLLEHGAQLDCKDVDNRSVLDLALDKQDFETCTFLVEKGASMPLDATSTRHFADWLAHAIRQGHVSTVTKILAAGFSIHCRSRSKLLIQVAYESKSEHPGVFNIMMQNMTDLATKAMAQMSISS